MKQKVIFIGFQERLHGLPVALVNDETGDTLAYEPGIHGIVNTSVYVRALVDEVVKVSRGFVGYAIKGGGK